MFIQNVIGLKELIGFDKLLTHLFFCSERTDISFFQLILFIAREALKTKLFPRLQRPFRACFLPVGRDLLFAVPCKWASSPITGVILLVPV